MAERNLILEYNKLLRESIRGIKVRAFFLGWHSQTLDDYITTRTNLRWDLENEAYQSRVPISNMTNSNLGAKLFGLEVKASMAKYRCA